MDAAPLIPDALEPLALFQQWFDDAVKKEPELPEAMSLATATPDGKPSLRMVLLKDVNTRGFTFYTNAESRKGDEIAANPHAAICFHWKSLGRQVRVEGKLEPVSSIEADAYWATRPRQSQIAGWASEQSQVLPGRGLLQARVDEFETRFAGKPVPRPPQWTGFRLVPQAVEFWHDVRNRLHDRLVFHRQGEAWRTERLYPVTGVPAMNADHAQPHESLSHRQSRLMHVATYAAMISAAVLVVVKASAYFDTKSVSLLSSLADSALDLLASGLTFLAVRLALTPADEGHRFGHGKAEPLSGLGQAAFVAGSAVLVLVEAISRFHNPTPIVDGTLGIIVMVISLVVTLMLVTFQRYVIKNTNSLAIGADSLHYTGDLLMNVSVIISLYLSSNMGIAWADPVFGIGISAFMLINAVRIAVGAVGGLMDHELPDDERKEIIAIARQHPKVKHVHELRTRSSGLQKFIQMHVVLDHGLTLLEAHRISDDVEMAVQSAFPGADIIIHQDPDGIAEYHQPVGAALSP